MIDQAIYSRLVEIAMEYAQANTPQLALSADDRAADLCGDDLALFEAYTILAAMYRDEWIIARETTVARGMAVSLLRNLVSREEVCQSVQLEYA